MTDENTRTATPIVAKKVARYPGVQPFGDDDTHRHLFRGRDAEQYELLQMVLAERLVLLFARSGVGKSSLINAGLLEPLRNKRYFPLVVRISGSKDDPLESLYDGIKAAVVASRERIGIEFKPTDEAAWNKTSLWHFFKTFEIWLNDNLLTPVLIVDQFEELFTLFSRVQRKQLIHELADVARGIRPVESRGEVGKRISDTAPQVKVVLALREDYYANLEELRQRIPAVYKTALRLNPLTQGQARAAIVEPAALESEDYSTPAFTWSDEALTQILDFLCEQQLGEGKTKQGDQVEPFQLQLICQHFETVVRDQQLSMISEVDVGGKEALKKILSDFYERSLAKICEKFKGEKDLRKKLEKLCEYGFITARGRRLLREESTIKQVDGIPPVILSEMVELRLLRKEPRVGDNYYELTHDTLIEPIQLSRLNREEREAAESKTREARERKKRNLFLGFGAAAMLCVAIVSLVMVSQSAETRVQAAEEQVGIAQVQVGIARVDGLEQEIAKYEAETKAAQAQLKVLAEEALKANEQLRLAEEIGGQDKGKTENSRQKELAKKHYTDTLKKISEEEKKAKKMLSGQQAARKKLQLEQQAPKLARQSPSRPAGTDLADNLQGREVRMQPANSDKTLAFGETTKNANVVEAAAPADRAKFNDLSICEQFDVLRNDDTSYGLNVAQKVAQLSKLNAMLEHSAVVVTQKNMMTSITKWDDNIEPEQWNKPFKAGKPVYLYIWFRTPGKQNIQIEYLDGNGNPVPWEKDDLLIKDYPLNQSLLQGERLGYRLHTLKFARAPGPDHHRFRVYNSEKELLCQRTFKVVE